jgi:hypothetical protein
MSAIVGIDAKVEISTNGGATWTEISERNEFSISINVDAAEHKVFVTNLANAWVTKSRTWMSWSGSLSGYYDDANDTIFNSVVAGQTVKLRFYDSRNTPTKYWIGDAILTSVEHSANTDDFATLSVDFEGQGPLTRVSS